MATDEAGESTILARTSVSRGSFVMRENKLGTALLWPGKEKVDVLITGKFLVCRFKNERDIKSSSKSFSTKSECQKLQPLLSEIPTLKNCIIVTWKDLLSCRIVKIGKMKPDKSKTVSPMLIQLISYEVVKVDAKTGCRTRQRNLLSLLPDEAGEQIDVHRLQIEWVDRIKLESRRYLQSSSKEEKFWGGDDEMMRKKKVLVIVCPISGSGKAQKILRDVVEPMLREGEVDYEVTHTQYKGHAKELVEGLENICENWDAIVTLSGDGIIHEILNGLMSRDDSNKAIHLPIGIIPCGTGNTTISNILNIKKELFSPLNATFILIRALHCGYKSFNIASVTNVNDEQSYHIISIYYGITPKVVTRTESLRFIGPLRYLFGILWYGLKGETYQAKLTYVPHDSNENQQVIEIINCLNFISILMPYLLKDLLIDPNHEINSNCFTLSIIENEVGYGRLIRNYVDRQNSPHLQDPRYRLLQVKEFMLEPILPEDYILAVDGDVIPSGPLKCEINANHIRFLM